MSWLKNLLLLRAGRSRNFLPDERKSRAYLVFSEWGPKRRIPRVQRLAEAFPDISAGMRATWISEFKYIEAEIWRIAEQGGPAKMTYETFADRMLKAFPFLNEQALRRAWALTGYYTWHEGYG